MSTAMNEQELLKNLAELPRQISPENDQWPRISARIGQSQPGSAATTGHRNRLWLAAAASVVLAVVAGLVFMPEFGNGRAPGLVPDARQVSLASPPGIVYTVDAEYQAAFREFISISDSQQRLQPQTVEKLESTWTDLRTAESALSRALLQNPDDPFLNSRMLELRDRQLGFLKQLVTLDRNNRRLTI